MPIVEMRIARRGLNAGMTQQPPDHRQCFLVHRRMACKCVPKIVDPQARQSGFIAELPPETIDIAHGPSTGRIPEHPGDFLVARDCVDDSPRLIPHPDHAWAGLAVAQLDPRPVDVVPVQAEDFTAPAPS